MSKKRVMIVALALVWCVGTAHADLQGLWTMNEGQGTVTTDLSGNGNDGTFEGSPLWVDGMYGSALELDGSSSVNCGDAPQLEITGPMTVACWVNSGDLTGDRGFLTRNASFALKSSEANVRFTTPGILDHTGANAILEVGVWAHVAVTFDPGATGGAVFYLNGVETDRVNASAINPGSGPVEIGHNQWGQYFIGQIDDVAIFDHILTEAEIQEIMAGIGHVELAANPSPEDAGDDVLRDTLLTWMPGAYAVKHDVYWGESFEDVNSATVPTAADLDVNSFDPGRLEFGKTYFWRVDEVNAAPDNTVFTGKVWSFTVEPYSIQIPGADIIATASTSSNEFSIPETTIDGSGLSEDGAHGIATETMWFTEIGDPEPWIQYEFEGIKKLDTMTVWNSNSSAEGFIGYGVNGVQIEYSTDGETWSVLEAVTELTRAPGLPTYNQPDRIAFEGAAAKVVRLNIQSNFGGFLLSYSVSEVQFTMIPVAARTPEPASDAVDIRPDDVASWRAGREAAQSTVYVGTDANEVADGLAASATSNTNSIDLGLFDLQMGETYYWRVDEVNNAEADSVWAGPVWSFSTVAALVVEDFESYGNDSPDRPFQTWLDGYGFSADEFFPAGYNGNGTGAGIGHDIWSVASEYYNGDIMEVRNTVQGSSQSMPFYYSNAGETQRTFAVPQDWTVGGAQTLSIPFFGQTGNTGNLYIKVNNTKISYDLEATDIALATWQVWNIDLSSIGGVANVTTLAIGVEGAGSAGMVLIDDIRLYPAIGELITPMDPGAANLVSQYNLDGNFNDSVGNHNGAALGAPQFTSDPARGQVMSLDGASNAVDVPHSADLNPEAFTASLWVVADASGTGHRSPLTSRDDGPAKGYIIYANPANTWQFWIGIGDGWSAVQGPAVATGEWTHLAATYADEQSTMYVNGFLVGTGTNPISLNTAQPLRIGGGASEGPGDYFFVGLIDDVRIYNRALSAGEALWLAGRASPIHKPF